MSEIAGIVRFGNAPVDRSDFQRMERVLKSRGGDSFKTQFGPSYACAFAGFQFTPEDLHDRQPLILPDKSYFVFCGRLDNRPDLIRDLGIAQQEASGMSDSAIAAQAWLRWSTDGLNRWIGPHITLIWCPDDQRLITVRGAPGGRSLIVHRVNNSVYFSTTVDALFALPKIPREFDEAVLADILLGAPSGTDFLYKGLDAMPASHWVVFTERGRTDHRYWRLERKETLKFQSEQECWEAFENQFSDVVTQHLRTTGEIGIRLSGGLDSSLLAAFCCNQLKASGRKLLGYTRVPRPDAEVPTVKGGHYMDESSKVLALAALYPNLVPNLIHADDQSVLHGLDDWYAVNHSPWNSPPTYQTGYRPLLEKARNDGVKLLLNAVGGNHTFSYTGYGRLNQLLTRGRWIKLRRELLSLKKFGHNSRLLFIKHAVKPSLPDWYRDWRIRQKSRLKPSWDHFSAVNPDFALQTGADVRLREQQNVRAYWEYWSSWEKRSQSYNSTNQILQGGGGNVLYGLDQRDPSADRRIIEFCLAIPERYYLHEGINRRLVRRGMQHLLPDCILEERKTGLQDADWFYRVEKDRDNIDEAFQKFKNDPDVSRFFDMDKIDAMWKEFESTDWRKASHEKVERAHMTMLGPLHAGGFVRWFHGKND